MATCKPIEDFERKREERRSQVMIGDLPADFLRITPITSEQQISLDEQAAFALQHQFAYANSVSGRLTISVIEAKLNKNYGLTRMDPYVRLKVANTIYETSTDYNGARNPRWNKNFNCFFIAHDPRILIEIFDECAFSLDERIAWATYIVPNSVLQGQTVNEWIELSGKLGDGKEGLINLIITCQPVPSGTLLFHNKSVMPAPAYFKEDGKTVVPENPLPDITDGAPVAPRPTVLIADEDFKQVLEMFPNIDEEIVRAIMESNRGNKDHTINALLEISDVT